MSVCVNHLPIRGVQGSPPGGGIGGGNGGGDPAFGDEAPMSMVEVELRRELPAKAAGDDDEHGQVSQAPPHP